MENRFERFSFAISEISRYWHRLTSEEMEKYGLKGTHAVYLTTLFHNPDGLTAPQICEASGRDKADVSRMMSIMEKKGLVTKESVNRNLYRAVFKLTDAGREAAQFVRERASIAVEIAGRDLTDEKRAVFYESLETIAVNLRELSEAGIPDLE